jgi:hypothetical protein
MITFKEYLNEAKYYQEPKRIKSAIPLVRKASGVRGKTEHSGRGAYMMYGGEFDKEQAINNIIRKLPEWKMKDIVADAARTPDGDLFIAFSDYVDNPYRIFTARLDDQYTPHVLGAMVMDFRNEGLKWHYEQVPGLRSIL